MRIIESSQFAKWLTGLRDSLAKHRIEVWMYRMSTSGQLLGDWKRLDGGLLEFRFFTGRGTACAPC